ncbi:unnamed protein product [Mytilus coruscus]|uniref:Integrase catalytic domain-containing protein n=1 Tax=Mytilus coruscus TaxID=42192 RepID=A0A6J8DC21_MYTCO|nr:unnamed protein product [Mytilus coruscus]
MEKQIKGPSIVRLSAISNCWFANVEIGGLDTNMLIDTGSAVTLISKENYDDLKCNKSKLIKVTSTLATADGKPLIVLGETKLSIKLGQRKPGPGIGKSPMQHRNVYRPIECITIDLMGPLPITDHSNEYIIVVSDYFTKWTEAYALKEHCAQTVADKLVTEFISRFGTPCRIHTDQGREFESKLFASMCDLLEIEKTRTTPYHPQSDGMVERYNRTLQQILSMFVNENKDDWDSHLPYVTMAYRALHTKKKYYDCKLKHRQFETGNKVLRWYPPKANKKLGLGWIGPYKISRKLSDITYAIEDWQNSKLKVVHVNHLKSLYTRDDTFDAPEQEEQLIEQTKDQSIWIDYTVDNITDIQDENVHKVETEPASPKTRLTPTSSVTPPPSCTPTSSSTPTSLISQTSTVTTMGNTATPPTFTVNLPAKFSETPRRPPLLPLTDLPIIPDLTPFSVTSRISLQEYKTRSQPSTNQKPETATENANSGHPDRVVATEPNNHSGCKLSITSSETQITATDLPPLVLPSIPETRPE